MQINLNDSSSFTIENVASLIGSVDDKQLRQLQVTKDGMAFISDTPNPGDASHLAFRLDMWLNGNGYTGRSAAKDMKWVVRVYNVLKKNWPNPEAEYIDYW